MKKMLYLIQLTAVALVFSSSAFADGGWGGHRDWGRHHGHHGWGHHGGHHGWGHRGHHAWRRPQVNNYYYSQPQGYYYQQPPVQYYQPQPQYYQQPQYENGGGYYDNRSHQGLAGGVVGSVFGYELGNGHPIAAGIGAAAGSFLGNGVGWRY